VRIRGTGACLVALGLLAGCMPLGKSTFQSATTGDGRLKPSDAAAHSTTKVQRVGVELVVEDAFHLDLRRLLDIDAGYRPIDLSDEAEQTRAEAVIATAIHGASGLGVFKRFRGLEHTPWAERFYERTQVGRPFLVTSWTRKRDDYYVVPVFFRGRWKVANHVGVSPTGHFYSNGFEIEDLAPESSASRTVYGLERAREFAHLYLGPLATPPIRVFADTLPPPTDPVLGYLWAVTTPTESAVIDTHGAIARLSDKQRQELRTSWRLSTPLKLQVRVNSRLISGKN